jgi:prephenate dehydrogenase
MTVQITIIGLGQIGASVGMALRGKAGIKRVGCDKDAGLTKAALTLDVVDEIKNLPGAVQEANIVLLCLPLGETREALKRIGPEIQENSVIMDTAPVKSVVLEWVKEFIPAGRFYLGLVPALNRRAFVSPETGFNAAMPDLFQRTVMVIDAPTGTRSEVVELAFQFCALLGAKPMLTDLAESDGLTASIHLLPQFVSAALLNATIDQPGWSEARKLASRVYAEITGGMAYYDDVASLCISALNNRESLLHSLDAMIAALEDLRYEIDKGDEAGAKARLNRAFEGRERWLEERTVAEWLKEGGERLEIPDLGEQVIQTLFGSRIIDRNKKKN